MPTADRHSKAVQRLEAKVFKLKQQLSHLRRKTRPKAVADYRFSDMEGKPLRLSQAFGRQKDLIVVHNMGRRCPYCTMWADGFNGVLPHLENRAAFLVASPDEPKDQKSFHRSRGWKFRMASTRGSTFSHDMGFEPAPGQCMPGYTTFRKKQGRIERVSSTFFGPGDDYCSVFHFFDLLADGIGDWGPKYKY